MEKEMTLREVLEYSKNISIKEGGLEIILTKIVEEIEKINARAIHSSQNSQ